MTLYTVWSDESPWLIHCLTNSLQQGGLINIHDNATSSALYKLWLGADLRNSSCQKSVGSSLENDSGGRGWICGLAAYPFVWVHNDLIHLLKVYLENDCSILGDWIPQYWSIAVATSRGLAGCINIALAVVDDDIWISCVTILHCTIRAQGSE